LDVMYCTGCSVVVEVTPVHITIWHFVVNEVKLDIEVRPKASGFEDVHAVLSLTKF